MTDKAEVIHSIFSVRVKHLGRGKSVELLLAECLRQIPASPAAVTRLMTAPHPMPQRALQHIKQRESGRECYSHRHICNRVFKGKTAKSLVFLLCSWQNLLLLWEDCENIDPEFPPCFLGKAS